ncbi:hypothetical protein [Dactylosporangium sp. NPDC051484]|uniref:hypothetical protein n=1 Tax=Dactylosporangium sp. NPDC051484 TaxID=3154942 RepID=UPI003450CDBA
MVVGAPVGDSFAGHWLIDVDSLERAARIAAATGGAVEIRLLMRDGPGPDL